MIASSSPWMTSIGQRTRLQTSSSAARSGMRGAELARDQHLGADSSAHSRQSSICFVECGSEKTLAEEELEEAAVVAAPVVAVVPRPALVAAEVLLERSTARPRSRAAAPAPMNERDRCHALRVVCREQQAPAARPATWPTIAARVDAARVEHRQRVGANSRLGVGRRIGGRSERPLPRRSNVTDAVVPRESTAPGPSSCAS